MKVRDVLDKRTFPVGFNTKSPGGPRSKTSGAIGSLSAQMGSAY
jgi:hypothetical protein